MGLHPERTAGVRGWAKTQTRCVNCPPQARPKSKRSKAQLFRRFRAWGNGWPHVLHIHGSLARAFALRVSSLSWGTGARLFPCLGKQKPCPGPALGKKRMRARRRERKDRVRDLPGAAAHPEPAACVRDVGKK